MPSPNLNWNGLNDIDEIWSCLQINVRDNLQAETFLARTQSSSQLATYHVSAGVNYLLDILNEVTTYFKTHEDALLKNNTIVVLAKKKNATRKVFKLDQT